MKILQSICKQSTILIKQPEQDIFTEHFILTLLFPIKVPSHFKVPRPYLTRGVKDYDKRETRL